MIPPLSSQQQPAQEGESGENLQEAVVQLQDLLEQKDLQWDELFAQFKGFRSQTDRERAEYRQQTQELEHRVEELASEAAALRKALFEKEKSEKELRRHRGQLVRSRHMVSIYLTSEFLFEGGLRGPFGGSLAEISLFFQRKG